MISANIETVKTILDNDILYPGYAIENKTGITRTMISRYCKDNANLLNMTLGTAMKLTDYGTTMIHKLAKDTISELDQIQTPIVYLIIRNNKVLADWTTHELIKVFSRDGYFGIEGHSINSQMDTRVKDFLDIRMELEILLQYGSLIDITLVPSNTEKYYMLGNDN